MFSVLFLKELAHEEKILFQYISSWLTVKIRKHQKYRLYLNSLGVICLNMFVFLVKLKIFSSGVSKGTYKNKNKWHVQKVIFIRPGPEAQKTNRGSGFQDLCSTFPISVALNKCGKTNWNNKVHHHPVQVRNKKVVFVSS